MATSALDIILRTKKTGTGATDIQKELDTAAKSASKLGEVAGGLLKAGLTAAAGAAVKAVTDTANYNREVRLLAQSINSTTEETSRLVQVADDVGVSQESLTRALQLASKNGFAPTIENIARLADETRAMTDPTEKAAALSKVFGRSWAELVPLLDMGGNAIKANADAVSDSLIVTKKASDATRALEIAQDNLGDAVDGLAHEFGNIAIPVVTDFFNLLKDGVETAALLIHWQDKLNQAQAEASSSALQAARSYKEYQQIAVSVAIAAGNMRIVTDDLEESTVRQDLAIGNLTNEYIEIDGQLYAVTKQTRILTEEQFNASRGAYGIAGALDESNRAATRAADAARNAAGATGEEGDAADTAAEKILTKAEADKIAADAALDATTAFLGTASALNDASKPIDYAKIALSQLEDVARQGGGVTDDRYNAAFQTLGLSAGIVSKESLAAARGIEAINKAFATKDISPEEYAAAIGKLPDAVKDGVFTLKEVGLGSLETIRKSKQDLLDETGNAAGDVVDKTSKAVSDSMLKVSNAVSATNSLIGTTGTAFQTNVLAKWDEFEKMPDIVKTITFNIEVNGQIPNNLPGRAGGGPVSARVPVKVNELFGEQFTPYQGGSMMPARNDYSTNIAPGAIVINAPQGMDVNALAAIIDQRMARRTRAARIMRGNG